MFNKGGKDSKNNKHAFRNVIVNLCEILICTTCKQREIKGNRRHYVLTIEVEWTYSSTLSLTSALDGVDCQRQTPAVLPPGKRPGTLCTVGCAGPRAGLDG